MSLRNSNLLEEFITDFHSSKYIFLYLIKALDEAAEVADWMGGLLQFAQLSGSNCVVLLDDGMGIENILEKKNVTILHSSEYNSVTEAIFSFLDLKTQ